MFTLSLSLLGLPIAFIIILLMVRKRIPYGFAIIAGAVIIGLFCGFTGSDFLSALYHTLYNWETINLTTIIVGIGILGYAFKETGQIDITINELRKIFGERTLLAALPAAFGMLPIPGGALMSAPIIDPEAKKLGLDAGHKSYLNLWFRHTLLLVFPISSMIIVPASLAGVSVYALIIRLVPLFFISIAVGYVVGLRPIRPTPSPDDSGSLVKAVYGLSPIILVIILNLVFHVPFSIGIIIGIALLFIETKTSLSETGNIIWKGFSPTMAVAMIGIMFFRQILDGSTLAEDLMVLLEGSPLLLLMIGLPMAVSLFTGLAVLSIGTTFPLLLPLSPVSPAVFASILYVSAYTGYLASPLHLCLILTKEYFKCSLYEVYKWFLPSIGVLICYNIIITFLLL
ncbi:MAG: DUF401 family protein [Theionarchaea archaeon]|nr:DUF401 family protein [Theionarchaea archaeon]